MGHGLQGLQEARAAAAALVVDASSSDSHLLSHALQARGYRVIVAKTPLEMIHHLQGFGNVIQLVVLASGPNHPQVDELTSFLAEVHPDLERVRVPARQQALGVLARPDSAAQLQGRSRDGVTE